jgi:AraC-like DNA-binding protein
MPMDPSEGAPLIFSTRTIPERERITRWREEFGRCIVHIDIEILSDAPVHAEATFRAVGGVRTVSIEGPAMRYWRGPADLGDSDDSIAIIFDGAAEMAQRGRDVVLRRGDATAVLHWEPGGSTFAAGSQHSVILPRDALALRVNDIESMTMRLIPRHSEALRLLGRYLKRVLAKERLSTPELRDSVTTHILDLAALALTESSPLGESTASAVVAARRYAVTDHITSHYQDPDLGVASVAQFLHISPRYLHRLLAGTGRSFTEHVTELRLQRAFTLLTDGHEGARRISDIAFEVGFSDISHFNRLFRSRFGDTPTGVRAQSRLKH